MPAKSFRQGCPNGERQAQTVKYRTLGRTGLEISEIGFGCGTSAGLMVGGPPDARRAAVERALERGITLFDTAPVYGDTLSETHLAQALRELGAKPVIATKVALETPDYDDLAGGVVRSIEGSLERLGLDVLPIVHMHNRVGLERMGKSPYGSGALLTLDDVLGKNGVVEGFDRAKRRGLVRFIGCTAFGGDTTSVEALIDSSHFDSIILNYSILNQSAWLDGPTLNPLFTYGRVGARAAQRGMGTVALRILEAGALATGFDRHPLATSPGAPDYATYIKQAQTLRFLGDEGDPTLVPAAIRFGLSNPDVSTVLVGISEVSHVDAAADAAERGPLSPEQLRRIEKLRANGFV
jgi:L-galactose dehydrogenase/L-glyceraldehyde 3-phosphate reductase